MKILKEKFKFDVRQNVYWGRVYFFSDNKEFKTRILWVATHEWMRRKVMLEKWNDLEVERQINKIVNKWKQKTNALFRQHVYYDVYGVTKEEEDAGSVFIRSKDKV